MFLCYVDLTVVDRRRVGATDWMNERVSIKMVAEHAKNDLSVFVSNLRWDNDTHTHIYTLFVQYH